MDIKKEIEKVFLYSSDNNELFDAFAEAIKHNFESIDIYKALIANHALSVDEIKMYTEKLISTYPRFSYDLFMWTANIFENLQREQERLEESFFYYSRALDSKPGIFIPYLNLLKLYNYDFETPFNQDIINKVISNVGYVHSKSKVYFGLANHFKKLNDAQMEAKYLSLGLKAAEEERRKKLE
jgi:tetratricopeptide (TPR) repeat protein